jgi:hypothetical protein
LLDNIVRPNGEDWVVLVTCKGGDVSGKSSWAEVSLREEPAGKNADLEKAVSRCTVHTLFDHT